MKYLSLDNWERKPQFEFFKEFEEPFFGINTQVDCTSLYTVCKDRSISFFAAYLHACMKAVNKIENFKYRILKNERVCVHDVIHASATHMRKNKTFGFTQINFNENFDLFRRNIKAEQQRVEHSTTLFPPIAVSDNVIHISAIPWISFTSLSHARRFTNGDSVPKISFGKTINDSGNYLMPISVHVHHALVDAYHVHLFLDRFQELLAQPTQK